MTQQVNFRTGYELAVKNAQAHLKAAELLSKDVNYGIANSHLILASEEAIKAYMIFSRHFDPELPLTDFNKYFEDHKHKHKTIRDMTFFMNLMLQMVKISLSPILKLQKSKQDYTAEQLSEKRKQGITDLIAFLNSKPAIDHNEQWWNNANNNKNKGFYINIINNKWQTPEDITKEDFDKSFDIVKQMFEVLDLIPEFETSPDAQAFYKKMKEKDEENKKNHTE